MIEPVKFNSYVSFKGADEIDERFHEGEEAFLDEEIKNEFGAAEEDEFLAEQPEIQEDKTLKTSAKDKFTNAKKGFTNIFKKLNTVTFTTAGIIKGAAIGVATTAGIGVIGKNIKDGKGEILASGKGIIKDAFKGVKSAVMFIPSLLTKSPIENIKNVITLPAKFYGKNYLNIFNNAGKEAKTHKITALIATLAGVGAFITGATFGKIRANEKNASLDHKANLGHVK